MEAFTEFEGRDLYYSISGKGPVLVLIHGFMETREMWEGFTDELSKHFTVICPDLPGHGKSACYSGTHTMYFMAEAVRSILKSLSINQLVIAGHSMGGYVALHFAKLYSDMLKGLTLFHSHAGADSDETKANRLRTIEIVKQNKASFISQFIPDLFASENITKFSNEIEFMQNSARQMTSEGIIAAIDGMRLRESMIAPLGQFTFPIQFIAGKQDSRLPVQTILSQAAIPQHSELLLLNATGHMGFIESKHLTLPALHHFAQRCYL
jgi:pimeloyl-ACP methyl ester carboxylesterase